MVWTSAAARIVSGPALWVVHGDLLVSGPKITCELGSAACAIDKNCRNQSDTSGRAGGRATRPASAVK